MINFLRWLFHFDFGLDTENENLEVANNEPL